MIRFFWSILRIAPQINRHRQVTAKPPSRLWQVFSGPEALEALPDDGHRSPWSFPAQVRIPMEHWEAIMGFARRLDPAGAELLAHASLLDGTMLAPGAEADFLAFLETLAKAVLEAAPLTPDESNPALIPEPMPNTSHAQMLRDIVRLANRTRRRGMTFDSWVD
jgi:hypothetical protein